MKLGGLAGRAEGILNRVVPDFFDSDGRVKDGKRVLFLLSLPIIAVVATLCLLALAISFPFRLIYLLLTESEH